MRRQSGHKLDNCCPLDFAGSRGIDNSLRCPALVRSDRTVFIFLIRILDETLTRCQMGDNYTESGASHLWSQCAVTEPGPGLLTGIMVSYWSPQSSRFHSCVGPSCRLRFTSPPAKQKWTKLDLLCRIPAVIDTYNLIGFSSRLATPSWLPRREHSQNSALEIFPLHEQASFHALKLRFVLLKAIYFGHLRRPHDVAP